MIAFYSAGMLLQAVYEFRTTVACFAGFFASANQFISNYSPGCVWGLMETLSARSKFLLRIGEKLKCTFQVTGTVRDSLCDHALSILVYVTTPRTSLCEHTPY